MKFLVPVSWTMMGSYIVDAADRTEAVRKVYDFPSLPKEGEYLSGSLEVDEMSMEELDTI